MSYQPDYYLTGANGILNRAVKFAAAGIFAVSIKLPAKSRLFFTRQPSKAGSAGIIQAEISSGAAGSRAKWSIGRPNAAGFFVCRSP